MKKILPAALLALVATSLSATSSFAGTFGLIPHGCCWGCCNSCSVCVRPYNAFSPVVSGNLCCDGVIPFNANGYGAGCCAGGAGCGAAGCDGCYGNLPTAGPVEYPQPVPSSAPPAATTTGYAVPAANVHTSGYRPNFYPGYGYSYGAAPQALAQPAPANVPSYWNDK
jgi:hypothetical protein